MSSSETKTEELSVGNTLNIYVKDNGDELGLLAVINSRYNTSFTLSDLRDYISTRFDKPNGYILRAINSVSNRVNRIDICIQGMCGLYVTNVPNLILANIHNNRLYKASL